MTPENFAYWLQGYFELSNPSNLPNPTFDITDAQIDVILNHINLVKITTPNNFFMDTIKLSLDALVWEDGRKTAQAWIVKKIVNAYFEHVIDPTHPDPIAANATHSPPKVPQTLVPPRYPSEPPRMRC